MKLFVFTLWILLCFLDLSATAEGYRLSIPSRGALGHIPTQIMMEAYKRIGISPVIVETSLGDSLEVVNSGECDAELIRAQGVEKKYPNLIRIPVVVFYYEVVAVTMAGHKIRPGWQGLHGCRVAYLEGSIVAELMIKDWGKSHGYSFFYEAIPWLLKGDVDVVLGERRNVQRVVMEIERNQVVVHSPLVESVPLYHYVHKRHASVADKLTEVLRKMETDGTIERMGQGSMR